MIDPINYQPCELHGLPLCATCYHEQGRKVKTMPERPMTISINCHVNDRPVKWDVDKLYMGRIVYPVRLMVDGREAFTIFVDTTETVDEIVGFNKDGTTRHNGYIA